MATANIPPKAQLSEAAEYRNFMFSQAMPRLQHLAWRAVNVLRKKHTEVVVVSIQVDSRWRDLVDILMPGHDWDSIRATGTDPIAQGTVSWSLCEFIAEEFPDIADIALAIPAQGILKAIVLSEGGCTIYDVEPKESPQQ